MLKYVMVKNNGEQDDKSATRCFVEEKKKIKNKATHHMIQDTIHKTSSLIYWHSSKFFWILFQNAED